MGVQIIENRNTYYNFTKSIQYLTFSIFYILGLGQYEAFSFQEDGFLDKQSNKEWAQLENKKLPELERLSICVWVKLHYHRTHNQVWSYCALKNFILVCSGLSMYKIQTGQSHVKPEVYYYFCKKALISPILHYHYKN